MKQTLPFVWQIDAVTDNVKIAAPPNFPIMPGETASHDECLTCHYAPNRWLSISTNEAAHRSVDKLFTNSQMNVTDITGFWTEFELNQASDLELLNAAAPIDLYLAGRNCGAMTLFDCPCILANINEQLSLFVKTSYAASFSNIQNMLQGSQMRTWQK